MHLGFFVVLTGCTVRVPVPLVRIDLFRTGKLVLVMRNVKDMLVSLHFFKGVAKDEWHGT